MRAAAFQFADPLRYKNVWLKADANMDMCRYAADRVEVCSGSLYDPVSQVVIDSVLDRVGYHRQTIFCVPGDMEVDLGIDAI